MKIRTRDLFAMLTACLLSTLPITWAGCTEGEDDPIPPTSDSSGKPIDTEIDWMSIPSGSFKMGSASNETDEAPVHRVILLAFEMLRSEVTVAQYHQCISGGACSIPDEEGCKTCGDTREPNDPVGFVTWHQAIDFCTWAGGRLPSEAEWEYAARSAGQIFTYPWGDETATCDFAVMNDETHIEGCGTGRTAQVCSKRAGDTAQGLCDMAGNVWEWVEDWYHESYNGAPVDGTAWVEPAGDERGVRGGSTVNEADYLRVSKRSSADPTTANAYVGFRCVR